MSIKTNTTDLQALLEVANNLPVAENLDTELATQDAKIAELQNILSTKAVPTSEDLDAEMSTQDIAIATQDDLIAQIMGALEGKTVPSAKKTVSVTIHNLVNTTLLYFNSDGIGVNTTSASVTIDALGGIIYVGNSSALMYSGSGDYVSNNGLYLFKSDGGILSITIAQSGGTD